MPPRKAPAKIAFTRADFEKAVEWVFKGTPIKEPTWQYLAEQERKRQRMVKQQESVLFPATQKDIEETLQWVLDGRPPFRRWEHIPAEEKVSPEPEIPPTKQSPKKPSEDDDTSEDEAYSPVSSLILSSGSYKCPPLEWSTDEPITRRIRISPKVIKSVAKRLDFDGDELDEVKVNILKEFASSLDKAYGIQETSSRPPTPREYQETSSPSPEREWEGPWAEILDFAGPEHKFYKKTLENEQPPLIWLDKPLISPSKSVSHGLDGSWTDIWSGLLPTKDSSLPHCTPPKPPEKIPPTGVLLDLSSPYTSPRSTKDAITPSAVVETVEKEPPPLEPLSLNEVSGKPAFWLASKLYSSVQRLLWELEKERKEYIKHVTAISACVEAVTSVIDELDASDTVEENQLKELTAACKAFDAITLSEVSASKRFSKECYAQHFWKMCEKVMDTSGSDAVTVAMDEGMNPSQFRCIRNFVRHPLKTDSSKERRNVLKTFSKCEDHLDLWKMVLESIGDAQKKSKDEREKKAFEETTGFLSQSISLLEKNINILAKDFCWMVLDSVAISEMQEFHELENFDPRQAVSTLCRWQGLVVPADKPVDANTVSAAMTLLAIQYRFLAYSGLLSIEWVEHNAACNRPMRLQNKHRIIQVIRDKWKFWHCATTLGMPKRCHRAPGDYYYHFGEPDTVMQVTAQFAPLMGAKAAYTKAFHVPMPEKEVIQSREELARYSGLLAVSSATVLCDGGDPSKYMTDLVKARAHLDFCLTEQMKMTLFPQRVDYTKGPDEEETYGETNLLSNVLLMEMFLRRGILDKVPLGMESKISKPVDDGKQPAGSKSPLDFSLAGQRFESLEEVEAAYARDLLAEDPEQKLLETVGLEPVRHVAYLSPGEDLILPLKSPVPDHIADRAARTYFGTAGKPRDVATYDLLTSLKMKLQERSPGENIGDLYGSMTKAASFYRRKYQMNEDEVKKAISKAMAQPLPSDEDAEIAVSVTSPFRAFNTDLMEAQIRERLLSLKEMLKKRSQEGVSPGTFKEHMLNTVDVLKEVYHLSDRDAAMFIRDHVLTESPQKQVTLKELSRSSSSLEEMPGEHYLETARKEIEALSEASDIPACVQESVENAAARIREQYNFNDRVLKRFLMCSLIPPGSKLERTMREKVNKLVGQIVGSK